MADDKQNVGGLSNSMDLSKVNTYGLDDERLIELQNAQKEAYDSLQQRYSQPNWFKVAAGFAKPQLGGFFASLGSAADALGDTVEAQRAQQLPMAELKMKMAQSNILMGQNKKASDMVADRRNKGLPITPEFAAEVARIAPDSAVAKALATEIGTQQKEQELAGQRISLARSMGKEPNPADIALMEKSTAPGSPPNPPAGGGQGNAQANVQPNAPANAQAEGQGNAKTGSISNEDFLHATHGLENIPAGQKAPNSSAIGPGGMIDKTRLGLQKKYNLPEGYGTDPNVTAQYENALLKDNAGILQQNNMEPNALNHRMTWWFGNDAPSLAHADPSSKISDVLSPKVIHDNGLDGNMRVGKLISRIEGNLWDQGVNPRHTVGEGAPSQGGAQGNAQGNAPAKTTELPLDPSDTKPGQNLKFQDWGFAPVPANATQNDFTKKQWEDREKEAQARMAPINQFGNPENNKNYRQNITQLMNYAEASPENRASVQHVLNVMGKNPALINAVLASAEEGFHGDFGSTAIRIGLPVKKFLENFNDPKDQKVAQMVMLAIDNANFVNAKIKGMSPTANIPAAEANLMTAGSLSRDTNFSSLMYTLGQLENNLDMYKNLYSGSQSLLGTYGSQLSPLASTHQITNSKWWNGTVKHYQDIDKQYADQYNKALSPKKKSKD